MKAATPIATPMQRKSFPNRDTAAGKEAMTMQNEGERYTRLALRRQRDVLRDVMLSSGECGTWLTLKELSQVTRYGEASISAQLRHLRKPRYGEFVVEKRRREDQEVDRGGAAQGSLWEYRLRRSVRLGAGAGHYAPGPQRGDTPVTAPV
jgi:hypothetical protein